MCVLIAYGLSFQLEKLFLCLDLLKNAIGYSLEI